MSNIKHIVVDVEADGPIPNLYSMVCFGAVVVEYPITRTFFGKTAPISDLWQSDALAISGYTRKEHEQFPEPHKTMEEFKRWLDSLNADRFMFWSDNNGFDWQWINYYTHLYLSENPFGWSSRRIGDIYCGMKSDIRTQWKHLRSTRHTHNPVDDAKGNAEALLKMKELGLKIKL